ncbi:MAG: PEP-CTERM sorting domain-containing protein [Nitrospiraceae bacterium]
MKTGVLGLLMWVALIGIGARQTANATPLIGSDTQQSNAETPWFCGVTCGDYGLGLEAWSSAFTLQNDAQIFQVNLCVGCATAIQTNIANITQINSIVGELMQLGDPSVSGSALQGYMTTFQTNLAKIVQLNLCLDCAKADQLNLADIEQRNLAPFGDPIGSQVPEPTTILLLGSGIVGLWLWRAIGLCRISLTPFRQRRCQVV